MVIIAIIHYIGYQFIFLTCISFVLFSLRRYENYQKADTAKRFKGLLIYGFLGWILAYLRIVLIQIYQILLLVQAGIDLTDTEAIQNAAITTTYGFNILGPLLSGIFEEGIRFWLLFKVVKITYNRYDREYAPIIFGLAWAYSEILIISIPFLFTADISIINLAISAYERLISIIFHISLTYLVIYAKITKKMSLWIAVGLHTGINLVSLVFVLETMDLDPVYKIAIIEGMLTIIILISVWWIRMYIRSLEFQLQREKFTRNENTFLGEN